MLFTLVLKPPIKRHVCHFNRYLVICHPMKKEWHNTPRRAKIALVFIWILATALSGPTTVQTVS